MECLGKTCRATAPSADCCFRNPPSTLSSLAQYARDFGCGLTPANRLNSGAGEGNRTPDPLITNQMLYRLSYASNWGKARLRANLSHGSLPDVRDNYIKYHTAKLGCNNGQTDPGLIMLSFQP